MARVSIGTKGHFIRPKDIRSTRKRFVSLSPKGKRILAFAHPLELDAKRQQAQKEKRKPQYDGTCRPPEGQIPSLPKDKPYTDSISFSAGRIHYCRRRG